MDDLALTIEPLAQRAWPPLELHDIDGWTARFTRGVTRRRSNSVATLHHDGDIDTSIAGAEAFYRERRADALFHLTGTAAPSGLDAALAARGYAVEAPTIVMTTEAAATRSLEPVELLEHIDDRWLETWTAAERRSDAAETARTVLDRIEPDHRFAIVDGAAVGVGVAEHGCLGVFGIAVVPDARRRGLGTRVVEALMDWARPDVTYAQVDETNAPSRALFGRLGFCDAYRYHYRRRCARDVGSGGGAPGGSDQP